MTCPLLSLARALVVVGLMVPAWSQAVPEHLLLQNDTDQDLALRRARGGRGGPPVTQRAPEAGLMGLGRPTVLLPLQELPLPKGSRTYLSFKAPAGGHSRGHRARLELLDGHRRRFLSFSFSIRREASAPPPAAGSRTASVLSLRDLLEERTSAGAAAPSEFRRKWLLERGVLMEVVGRFHGKP